MLQTENYYIDMRDSSQYIFQEIQEEKRGAGDILLAIVDVNNWPTNLPDDAPISPIKVIGRGEFLRHFRPFHANFSCGHCGKLEWRPIHLFSSGHTTVMAGGQCMWCGCALCDECPEVVGREICS